jgi:Zn-dependent M28 family amino/carboxypeptidase
VDEVRQSIRVLRGTLAAGVIVWCTVALAAHLLYAQSKQPAAVPFAISGERMLSDIRTLSSDEFQGRGPGTRGEDLTIAYVEKQFRDAGLDPGNPDGTYLQGVPLVGIRPDPNMELVFSGHGASLHEKYRDDFIATTTRLSETVKLDAELVFVGYGVQAPEYSWDDFKGVDVKGKVLIVLINDPPVKKGADLDPHVFGGRAMTYYGRWTYKYEKAAQMGAAGCLIVHETIPAAYPWDVVRNSWSGEQFSLEASAGDSKDLAVRGWITGEVAASLFRSAGYDFQKLKAQAVSRDFHPVPLGMRAAVEIHDTVRRIHSHNVIARLTGSDPALRNQYVIYTAHWDHFGIGPEINGQNIYHGALDNGSGSATLMELGRAFGARSPRPKRTILFLSVTAEEQGLLGSEYYAEHPLYPLASTAAEINMDGMNVLGKTRDITIIGLGQSSLDLVAEAAARAQGRIVRPDPEPEKGFYYRSDHFSFAKVGVPALDLDSGIDYIGKQPGWGMKMRNDYTANDYHKPTDVIKPYWKMDGDVEDTQFYLDVGERVANSLEMPQWSAKSEFKAMRDKLPEQ